MDNWGLIITHPGRAHRDEYYAVGLAAAINFKPIKVERRYPTPEELENPRVLVLDVGGRLEPEKSNFDHHQLTESELDGQRVCAFSLLAAAMQCDIAGMSYHSLFKSAPWYRGVILQDVLGPEGMAKELGLPSCPEEMTSGIETWILSEFGRGEKVDGLWVELARDLVISKRDSAIAFRRAQDVIARNHEWLETPVGLVFWAPTLLPFGINEFIKNSGRTAVATVTKEPRNGKICLFRCDESIDFNRLRGRVDTEFVHVKGFVANGTWDKDKIPEILILCKKGKEEG